ncbi:MAG: putative transcription factor [Archaeoglobi archaeon]|nr:putative transcription factor [Archaeoglobi archaeon]MDK2781153.1 putative transcription factor [Archaeoglobi archaeon]
MFRTPYICFVKQDVRGMQCEICGREVSNLKKVRVGRALMNVCDRCAHLGEEVHETRVETPRRAPPKRSVAEMPVEDIIPNYSEVIREARERLGLSQEELARKIKEKVSLIRKIERGELTPEEKVARKLEKELGIKLMERIESPKIEKKELPSTLTLGDVVVVRRKGE